MLTVTPTLGLDLPPAVDQFIDCGCTEVVEHYILLFPYYWLAGSLILLVTLNVLATIVDRGFSCDSFGTVLLMSFMSPSLIFLVPQAALHLFHFVWLISGVFQWFSIPRISPLVASDASLSYWDKYQIVYAQWANSGAVTFMVTGCICPMMTGFLRQILQLTAARKALLQDLDTPTTEGQLCVTVEAAHVFSSPEEEETPTLQLDQGISVTKVGPVKEGWAEVRFAHEDYSPDKFTGYVKDGDLEVDNQTTEKLQFKNEEIQRISEEMQILGKSRKPLFRELTSYLMVFLFLPCIFTHIIPACLMYFWIVGPFAVACRFLVKFAILKPKPSAERYSMWYRSVILVTVAFFVSACFQTSYNYAMFTYIGKIKYFDVMSNEYTARDTGCAMCMLATVQHSIAAISFL